MSFYKQLSVELQEHLQSCGVRERIKTDQLLIERGRLERTVYIILSGELSVETGGKTIILKSGDVLGEVGFLENLPRTADVKGRIDSTVLALDRGLVFERLNSKPLLLSEFIEALVGVGHNRLLLSQLPLDLRKKLQHLGQWRSFKRGDYVIRKGELHTSFFLVLSGLFAVDNPVSLTYICSGGIVGEMAFLENCPRSADVIAVENAEALEVPRAPTLRYLSEYPDLLMQLVDTLELIRRSRSWNTRKVLRNSEAFMTDMLLESRLHKSMQHPHLYALESGKLPDSRGAIKRLLMEQNVFLNQLPLFLAILATRLDQPLQRQQLFELPGWGNSSDNGRTYPELMRQLHQVFDPVMQNSSGDSFNALKWREGFISLLKNGTLAEAIGAVGPGYFFTLQTLYLQLRNACERIGVLELPPKQADDIHSKFFNQIVRALAEDPESQRDLRMGMVRSLDLQATFLDWVQNSTIVSNVK